MEIDVYRDGEFPECPGSPWLRNLVLFVLQQEQRDKGVSLSLLVTGQEKIQELNREYRDKDEPTDVLSFAMSPDEDEAGEGFITPPDGVTYLGEVIVSCPQAVLQAEERGHSIQHEVATLVIHGVLHLLGYDHDQDDDARVMESRERELLEMLAGEL